jgi:hypothetical protein
MMETKVTKSETIEWLIIDANNKPKIMAIKSNEKRAIQKVNSLLANNPNNTYIIAKTVEFINTINSAT